MLEHERPPLLTDEHIIQNGRDAYERYSTEAHDSAIPASFLGVSEKFGLDYFLELSPNDLAEVIFETKFESDRQAWLAFRYTEAIAAIKSFDAKLEYDSDGPTVNSKNINRMYLYIGIATVNEFNDDTTEAVKQRVEDYFEAHPEAPLRLEFLLKQAEKSCIQ